MSRATRQNNRVGAQDIAPTTRPVLATPLTTRGNGVKMPRGRAPFTTTPTITFSGSGNASGQTPKNYPATLNSGVAAIQGNLSPYFTFVGGQYIKPSTTVPGRDGARTYPIPLSVFGFGSAIVEFLSDAPFIQFYQANGEAGTVRVLVDGVETHRREASPVRQNTAQAGGASTITLDTGASAVNGFYVTRWVRIISGTGAGQARQITGYVGSTKVATVGAPWTTAPDNTSVFFISYHRSEGASGSAFDNVTYDWGGERRFRRYRVECSGTNFYGVNVSNIDTVMPADQTPGETCVWGGDSFSAGTYGDGSIIDSLAAVACGELGWNLINTSVGGTGLLNPLPNSSGINTLNLIDRWFPPTNSWALFLIATAGTFTLTQGGVTTGQIAYNASLATVQAAVTAAFGNGSFDVVGPGASGGFIVLVARNAPSNAAVMSIDTSALTFTRAELSRYAGALAPNVPTDGNGNPVPFNLVIAMGHNDTTSTNAAYTPTVLQTALQTLLATIASTYPTARTFVVGSMYLPGNPGSDVTTANAALKAACVASLPKINGVLPFIDTISGTSPWVSGTGRLGAQTGTGNSDVLTDTDGVHPTPFGHLMYGARIALEISRILGRHIVPSS